MAQSIDKPAFFNGEHYAYWKNKLMLFIKAKDFHLWDIVEDGPFVPTMIKSEWSAIDRKKMELNCKALHILFCALGPDVYAKVSSCESAKEVWDKLEVIHEGTNDVKEARIGLLNLEYENFKMDPNEDIKGMFNHFSTIVNQLKGLGEEISEEKLIRKLIYSLPESWDSKKTAIIEAKDLKKLKLDELIGSLLTHELMSIPLKREKEKIIKEQGVDVNVIALKSSNCRYEDSSMEESSEEDEEIAYLFKNFTWFMKSEKEKSKHEPKKKMKESYGTKSSKEERHTKYDCPCFNNKGSSSKKAYVATWSDEDSTKEEKVAHLCFMALEEGEPSPPSKLSVFGRFAGRPTPVRRVAAANGFPVQSRTKPCPLFRRSPPFHPSPERPRSSRFSLLPPCVASNSAEVSRVLVFWVILDCFAEDFGVFRPPDGRAWTSRAAGGDFPAALGGGSGTCDSADRSTAQPGPSRSVQPRHPVVTRSQTATDRDTDHQ
ncbi:hypothetical protein V6N12_010929 [Hibiscus sabdariffa]|uniref:DUF4219 domain-containing protein n=1 Tax=Hibiscus sabdariffa TaxID=183260 RepID=A0ABR2ELY7_9ROSI